MKVKGLMVILALATMLNKMITRKILITFTLLLATQLLLAQYSIKPYHKNDNWGFKNKEGKLIVQPKYELAKNPSDNYGIAFIKGDVGAFNAKAVVYDSLENMIIGPKYRTVQYIGNGLFKVWKQDKYFGQYNKGILNSSGEIIVPVKYRNIIKANGYFVVTKVIDSVVGHYKYMSELSTKRKMGIYSINGNKVVPTKYNQIKVLNNGYFVLQKDKKEALFSTSLKQLTGFNYNIIGNFFSGFSKAGKKSGYGYLNLKGEEEIPFIYKKCSVFLDGYGYITKQNGEQTLIDSTGKTILKNDEFDILFGSPNKNQIFAIDDGNYGIVNLEGKVLLPFEYDKIKQTYHGITFLRKNNKWRVWDADMKKLLPTKYDYVILIGQSIGEILSFGPPPEKQNPQSLAIVKKEEKWGVINKKGEVIEPFKKNRENNLLKKYLRN